MPNEFLQAFSFKKWIYHFEFCHRLNDDVGAFFQNSDWIQTEILDRMTKAMCLWHREQNLTFFTMSCSKNIRKLLPFNPPFIILACIFVIKYINNLCCLLSYWNKAISYYLPSFSDTLPGRLWIWRWPRAVSDRRRVLGGACYSAEGSASRPPWPGRPRPPTPLETTGCGS